MEAIIQREKTGAKNLKVVKKNCLKEIKCWNSFSKLLILPFTATLTIWLTFKTLRGGWVFGKELLTIIATLGEKHLSQTHKQTHREVCWSKANKNIKSVRLCILLPYYLQTKRLTQLYGWFLVDGLLYIFHYSSSTQMFIFQNYTFVYFFLIQLLFTLLVFDWNWNCVYFNSAFDDLNWLLLIVLLFPMHAHFLSDLSWLLGMEWQTHACKECCGHFLSFSSSCSPSLTFSIRIGCPRVQKFACGPNWEEKKITGKQK